MQLFTGKHVAVLNVVEKLTRQTCRKKSGVFSLPFPPGGANSGVAILFAVNTVSSINAKVLTGRKCSKPHKAVSGRIPVFLTRILYQSFPFITGRAPGI